MMGHIFLFFLRFTMGLYDPTAGSGVFLIKHEILHAFFYLTIYII
jgi:hypothetical protein